MIVNKSSCRHSSGSTHYYDHSPEICDRKPPAGLQVHNLRRRPLSRDNQNQDVIQQNQNQEAIEQNQFKPTLGENGNIIVIVVVAVVIFSIIFGWYTYISQYEKPRIEKEMISELDSRQLMVHKFTNYLKGIMLEFPSQTKMFWAGVAAASKCVLKTEMPLQPGIMLLVSSKQGKNTMRCLSQKISDILMKVYDDSGITVFHMDDHLRLNGSYLKVRIDETFQKGLQSRRQHVAILHNLEKVMGQAAMMLHGYCDNESAPFKDAIFIFTVELSLSDEKIASMEERQVAEMVESLLQKTWQTEIGYDNAMALNSRVANNIGVVKIESSLTGQC